MINDLWYKNAIVYCLSVGTFMDSDGDGVGDFKGLMRRLDYLHGLGATALLHLLGRDGLVHADDGAVCARRPRRAPQLPPSGRRDARAQEVTVGERGRAAQAHADPAGSATISP